MSLPKASPGRLGPLMSDLVIPLDSIVAGDAERVGPKAASLAALMRAGLPTPGGFCLSAAAYRAQVAALGLAPMIAHYNCADPVTRRQLSVDIRLALYEQAITP